MDGNIATQLAIAKSLVWEFMRGSDYPRTYLAIWGLGNYPIDAIKGLDLMRQSKDQLVSLINRHPEVFRSYAEGIRTSITHACCMSATIAEREERISKFIEIWDEFITSLNPYWEYKLSMTSAEASTYAAILASRN